MSAATTCRAAERHASSNAGASTRPSPIAIFSVIAKTRCVENTKVLRSGETRPRWIARPASISSEAITKSTSPGAGISASTGSCPAALISAVGKNSR